MSEKLEQKPLPENVVKVQKLLLDYLNQIETALGTDLEPERKVLYIHSLEDLTTDQIDAAFGWALKNSKFFPSIAELRDIAANRRSYTRQEEESRKVLDVPKPKRERFDDVIDELNERAKRQFEKDLVDPRFDPNEKWPKLNQAHIELRYTDWVRIRENRKRHANGLGPRLVPKKDVQQVQDLLTRKPKS